MNQCQCQAFQYPNLRDSAINIDQNDHDWVMMILIHITNGHLKFKSLQFSLSINITPSLSDDQRTARTVSAPCRINLGSEPGDQNHAGHETWPSRLQWGGFLLHLSWFCKRLGFDSDCDGEWQCYKSIELKNKKNTPIMMVHWPITSGPESGDWGSGRGGMQRRGYTLVGTDKNISPILS